MSNDKVWWAGEYGKHIHSINLRPEILLYIRALLLLLAPNIRLNQFTIRVPCLCRNGCDDVADELRNQPVLVPISRGG